LSSVFLIFYDDFYKKTQTYKKAIAKVPIKEAIAMALIL